MNDNVTLSLNPVGRTTFKSGAEQRRSGVQTSLAKSSSFVYFLILPRAYTIMVITS